MIYFILFYLWFRMVGRAAFTGNHQWILSETYTKETHPPEVIESFLHTGFCVAQNVQSCFQSHALQYWEIV